jgi:hypothetical protein
MTVFLGVEFEKFKFLPKIFSRGIAELRSGWRASPPPPPAPSQGHLWLPIDIECFQLIGLLFLLVGVLVLLSSMFQEAKVFIDSPHPLLTLHSTVYRSCMAVALIAYPIVQLATAKDILFYPLRSLALCVISFVRFVDILILLDYRNVGQNTNFAWTLFSLVELLSLGGHFATICLCATLLDVALNRVPRFDFGEAPEVTSNGRHSSRLEIKESEPVGYRQLETNDDYGDTQ